MLNFFKQLFCNHEYDFHRCTFGDENNRSIPNRKVEKCNICNYERYVQMTDEDWLRSDWELVGEDMRKVLGIREKIIKVEFQNVDISRFVRPIFSINFRF